MCEFSFVDGAWSWDFGSEVWLDAEFVTWSRACWVASRWAVEVGFEGIVDGAGGGGLGEDIVFLAVTGGRAIRSRFFEELEYVWMRCEV